MIKTRIILTHWHCNRLKVKAFPTSTNLKNVLEGSFQNTQKNAESTKIIMSSMRQSPPMALLSSSGKIYSWLQDITFSWKNTINLLQKCIFYLKFAIRKAPILFWSKLQSIPCLIVTQTLQTNTTKDLTWLWSCCKKMSFRIKLEFLSLIGHTKDGNKKASTFTWLGTRSVWKIKKRISMKWIRTENIFISRMSLHIIRRERKEGTVEALCSKYRKMQKEIMWRLQVCTKDYWQTKATDWLLTRFKTHNKSFSSLPKTFKLKNWWNHTNCHAKRWGIS